MKFENKKAYSKILRDKYIKKTKYSLKDVQKFQALGYTTKSIYLLWLEGFRDFDEFGKYMNEIFERGMGVSL